MSLTKVILEHKRWVILLLLLIVHIFFRFYQLEDRHQFTWDQVDTAWVAKNLIVDGKYPLLGVPVKQDSGFYMGPAYYYIVSLFYYLFDLDPIASAVLAGITSIVSFIVLFFVTKKIFSFDVGLVAVFIYAVSFYVISQDRVQWTVGFIGFISLGIFYCFYKILLGEIKYVLFLALLLGFSFHIHFTSVFYIIIIFFTLPLFPRATNTWKYYLFSLPLLLIWFTPYVLAELNSKNREVRNLSYYIQANYHGVHVTRILQLTKDAFIEFEQFLIFKFAKPLKFFLIPLFLFIYSFRHKSKERIIFAYLLLLWFLVPWFVLSVYKGEISNYYFRLTLPLTIITISYLLTKLLQMKFLWTKVTFCFLLSLFAIVNINDFFNVKTQGLVYFKKKVEIEIKNGKQNAFLYGAPESYLYYFYDYKKKKDLIRIKNKIL